MAAALPPGVKHCAVHDVQYGKLEQCSACRAASSGLVAAASPRADTSALRVTAARYRLNEEACWAQCKSIIDDGHIATKWSAESGKWATRADELETKLLDIEHHQWMLEQDKQRRGAS